MQIFWSMSRKLASWEALARKASVSFTFKVTFGPAACELSRRARRRRRKRDIGGPIVATSLLNTVARYVEMVSQIGRAHV